ncbi:TRAP transporter large permease [Hydrogenophaga taeniospiralis]|uniref:TRAP transporter large permease n=1 Tax=Hydrogenophaga taeniospiralis TaxID=65656 RepID=UPI001CFC130F|nr:TRAP transporter large permease [Hydrogenophaga taeniospiralis]MCB4363640.1 TRAP transporter large permease [Hydrogenophaga taeniospiralis]
MIIGPALILILLLGVPVGVAFTLLVMVNAERWNIDWSVLPSITYDTVTVFPLLAIPLFLLGGQLMSQGGLIRQLTAVCDVLIGRLHAHLGHVMVLASALMGAITGSSVATVAAMGSTVGKEMIERGYSPGYTAALNASAGLLGVLIPPSIPLILYGSIVGVSITQLFMASLGPGIVMMLAFMIVHASLARRVLPGGREKTVAVAGDARPAPDVAAAPRASIFVRALPALMLPVLVLGGIYSGVFTPTEAAAIAALYALLITLVSRAVGLRDLEKIFLSAALSAAAILVIIGFTSIFNRAMVLEQVPQSIATWAVTVTDSPIVFLLVVNLILLVVGMFMETNAATLLMGPLLAPTAAKFGIDPIHFAIILVTNIELGLLTPPLAANLYVAARTNRVPIIDLLRNLGWFLLASLVVMALITYVPHLALWYRMF